MITSSLSQNFTTSQLTFENDFLEKALVKPHPKNMVKCKTIAQAGGAPRACFSMGTCFSPAPVASDARPFDHFRGAIGAE
jgi:hypothetical protein